MTTTKTNEGMRITPSAGGWRVSAWHGEQRADYWHCGTYTTATESAKQRLADMRAAKPKIRVVIA